VRLGIGVKSVLFAIVVGENGKIALFAVESIAMNKILVEFSADLEPLEIEQLKDDVRELIGVTEVKVIDSENKELTLQVKRLLMMPYKPIFQTDRGTIGILVVMEKELEKLAKLIGEK
jgi:transcriptional regulator of aromatic amino acid metabolism